jgi:ELP3 family radical SAM enzyme/protein acetyltransferase
MTTIKDIEDSNIAGINHLFLHDTKYDEKDVNFLIDLIDNINNINEINKKKEGYIDFINIITEKEYNKLVTLMRKKHHTNPGVIILNYLYKLNIANGNIKPNKTFEKFNIRNETRTTSGITQITVLTSPRPNGQDFTCEHNCYYCPNEPAHEGNDYTPQPRSYLYNEPAVRRANQNKFDAAWQVWTRASGLELCGLPVDKVEMYILGGTWGSYPIDYRIEFVRDLYYAANCYYDSKNVNNMINMINMRPRLTLEEEMLINETTDVRIIGLTMETRPDHVTADEIELLRRMNCTRVQIGVQHIDNEILKKINRGCYYDDIKRAIYNLLNCGFKIEVHLMFDLPFSSPSKDKEMIDHLFIINSLEYNEYNFADPNITFDEAKYYPFQSVDWTVTKQWEDKGEYLHYSHEDLIDVLIHAKQKTPPSVRLARVIRDIPVSYVYAGNDVPNLRQLLEIKMKKDGLVCKCIRCREVRNKKTDIDDIIINVRDYEASNGHEYFISIESHDKSIIFGFCRLRLSNMMGYIKSGGYKQSTNNTTNSNIDINLFPYLNNIAMVRELHVYGNMTPINKNMMTENINNNHHQHRGFGKILIAKAEEIAINNNYNKIAIISGIGVRKYYEKLGYHLDNNYMMKNLENNNINYKLILLIILINFSIYFIIF